MPNCKTIAICNQKGGTGKTITTVNLGVELARLGKKVLLVDADPQGDLTTCLGWRDNVSLTTTITDKLSGVIREDHTDPRIGILHHEENVDLLPANIELSAMEMMLVTAMSRETILRSYLSKVKDNYDYVLIDCMPSLGMVTLNALAAADSVIIPVQAQYLPAKGMTQLMPGVYTVTEMDYDKYEPQESRRVTVVSGQVSTVNFNNKLKRGDLQIIKSSEDNLNEGVTFHLYGTSLSGIAVDEYAVTDANGVATFEDVLISGSTPYTVEEVDTAVRYVIPKAQSAPINWNEVTNRSCLNILKKFSVTVTKSDAETGTAVSRELYLGKYEVREITAPHGMVLNPEPHCVELVYAGQNVAVTETATSFENERQKVEISLVKSIEQNEHFGIGTNGEMKNISFGLFAAGEIVSASGASIPENGLVEIISLNEDGTAKVKTDLPFGSYYVQELATDSHYKLSDTKYPVTFGYAGQDTAVVKIAANVGKAIENDLIYGSVSGKKVDENDNALGGALIGLFRTDDGEFTKENALMTTTSAKDGSFSFENIPYGTWYVREIEQPTGFVLDDTIYPVPICADGQVVEIEIVNR